MDKKALLSDVKTKLDAPAQPRGVGDELAQPQKKFKVATFSFTQEDLAWMSDTLGRLQKIMNRRISKSEIIRAGLKVLKNRSLDSIIELLRD